MYEDAIKTTDSEGTIALRELTELIEEALLPAPVGTRLRARDRRLLAKGYSAARIQDVDDQVGVLKGSLFY
jgi:hypothetical protein